MARRCHGTVARVPRPGGSSLVLLAAVFGCGGGGSLVQVDGTVPSDAEALTVTVLKTRVIERQAFTLVGRPLPQTIALSSGGQTQGELIVVAEATVADRVVAAGWTTLRLGDPGSVHLGPSCMGAGCRCAPSSCSAQGATCGVVLDGCGGVIDCGACSGTVACSAGTCPAGACGLVADGCGSVLTCMPCSP